MPSSAPDQLPSEPVISKKLLEELTGRKVLSYTIEDRSKPGDGYMSVLHSVSVELAVPSKEGEPAKKEMEHFLFKCFPSHPSRQPLLCTSNMFFNELSFYQVWLKALRDMQVDTLGLPENEVITPAFPLCVGGRAIDFTKEGELSKTVIYKPLDNFIVMKDLKKGEGLKMVNKADGLSLDHLQLVFPELAKMHALAWAYKSQVEWNVHAKFPFLESRFQGKDKELWENVFAGSLVIAKKAMDEKLGEGNHLSRSIQEFKSKVTKVIDLFLEQKEETDQDAWELHRSSQKAMVEASKNDKPWRIQIHGDAYCNNMMFKYDESTRKPTHVTLFDFQLSRQACPTLDLVYCIYTSTTGHFRRLHLDSLLQLYCKTFHEFCDHLKVAPLPGFGFESVKRRFHRTKLIGYMIAVIQFPMTFAASGKAVDLEEVDKGQEIDDMMLDTLSKGALGSSLYRERIIETAQDLYDDGVI